MPPDADWVQEADPRHKYRTDLMYWAYTEEFRALEPGYNVITDDMVPGADPWTQEY